MLRSSLAAALLVPLALGAAAQTLRIVPAHPGTADVVVLEGDVGGPRCPVPQRSGLTMANNTIVVEVAEALDCNAAPFSRFTLTLGRFPAGDYRVVLQERNALSMGIGNATLGDAAFNVAPYGTAMRENMTGHWTTDVPGEGVSITQTGTRVFFTWLTYGFDGRPTWLVVPDAGWQAPTGAKRGRFSGALYAAHGAPSKGVAGMPFTAFAGIAASGSAAIVDTGKDTATLELRFEDGHELTRTLKRLRF